MRTSLNVRLDLLKLQIELDESNYKYAVELQKDYNTLLRMRENIKRLKEELQILIEEIMKKTSVQ
jgi:predicted phage-related endonuclease